MLCDDATDSLSLVLPVLQRTSTPSGPREPSILLEGLSLLMILSVKFPPSHPRARNATDYSFSRAATVSALIPLIRDRYKGVKIAYRSHIQIDTSLVNDASKGHGLHKEASSRRIVLAAVRGLPDACLWLSYRSGTTSGTLSRPRTSSWP